MKRVIFLLLLLVTLSGCNYFNMDDIEILDEYPGFDDVEFPDEFSNYEYSIIRNEMPTDVVNLLDSVNILTIKIVNHHMIVVYYTDSVNNETLIKFNNDYTIDWTIAGYRNFYTIEGNNDDSIVTGENLYYIEYCEALLSCKTGIFDEDGTELYATDNIEGIFTSNDSVNVPDIPIEIDDEFYVVERPDRNHQLVYEEYVFARYNEKGREKLHSFYSSLSVRIYKLYDDSFVFAYRMEGYDRRYMFEHVSKDGLLLAQYESIDSFDIYLLTDGYITYSNGIMERKDFNDELVWQVSHIKEKLHIVNEQAGLVFISSSIKDYKITLEGEVIEYEISEMFDQQMCQTRSLSTIGDGYCVNTLLDSEDDIIGLSISNNNDIIWSQTFDSVYGIQLKNNLIYVAHTEESDQYITIFDLNGDVVSEFTYDGKFQFVNDQGNVIISSKPSFSIVLYIDGTEDDNIGFDKFTVGSYLTEYKPDGELSWKTILPYELKDVFLHEGYYHVIVGEQESFSTMPTFPSSPTWDVLVDADGNIVFDTSEGYGRSVLLGATTDYTYYRVDDEDNFQTVIEVDFEGNVVETYTYLGRWYEDSFFLGDNEIVILEYQKLFRIIQF